MKIKIVILLGYLCVASAINMRQEVKQPEDKVTEDKVTDENDSAVNNCPKIGSVEGPEVFQDQSIDKTAGDWYLLFKSVATANEYDCMMYRYEKTDTDGKLNKRTFYNDEENTDIAHVSKYSTQGDATIDWTFEDRNGLIQVIDTDNEKFMITYECEDNVTFNLGKKYDIKYDIVHIYVRDPNIDLEEEKKLFEIATKKLKVDIPGSYFFEKDLDRFLMKFKQGDDVCQYYKGE